MTSNETDTVLITGSSGFVGQHVVVAAQRAGLRVRALVRPGARTERLLGSGGGGVEVVRADLRAAGDLPAAVRGCDTVVHLAATKTGDFAARFGGTVVATENLLTAMDDAGIRRLVHCSSISVYRSGAVPPGGLLDEKTPLESQPAARDDYAQVKLEQEELVRRWASRPGRQVTVLRPGIVYGPDELWNALLGVEILPSWWIGVGVRTRLPLAWVENVADAFVTAVLHQPLVTGSFNIIDDRTPSIRAYTREVRPLVDTPPHVLQLGYPLARALVGIGDRVDRRLLDGRLKLPGGLSPVPFEARFRPLRYSNAEAKTRLGWQPRQSFPETVRRSAGRGAPQHESNRSG